MSDSKPAEKIELTPEQAQTFIAALIEDGYVKEQKRFKSDGSIEVFYAWEFRLSDFVWLPAQSRVCPDCGKHQIINSKDISND